MRKQDIKPGVVYAYQRDHSYCGRPLPVVFLNTPAGSELYSESSVRPLSRSRGMPAFYRAHAQAKPHAVSFGSDVGYPAVRFRWDATGHISELLSVTLADFEAAVERTQGDREFTVITSLAAIVGPWDEVKAAYDERKRANDEQKRADAEAADASRTRAMDVMRALRAYGVEVSRLPAYGAVKSVSLSLEEAEKLVAVLRESGWMKS
jgi:hypothetical protein